MTTKFCTVADVSTVMRMESGFTGDNALIELYILQATEMLRQFTRRQWSYGQYVDYLDTTDIDTWIRKGKGVYTMSLRERPVVFTDSVYPVLKYSPSGKWADTEEIPRENYDFDTRKNQVVMYPGVLTSYPRAIRCTYTAGYPTQDIAEPNNADADPELVMVKQNLRQACIAQAAYMVRRELNTTAGSSRDEGGNRMRGYWMTQTGLVREALSLVRTEVRTFVGGMT